MYLDDILVLDQEEASLRRTQATVAKTPPSLGVVINIKTIFEPAQTLDFLGFRIDSQRMTIQLSLKKVRKECQHMMNQGNTTPRKLAHLIGL